MEVNRSILIYNCAVFAILCICEDDALTLKDLGDIAVHVSSWMCQPLKEEIIKKYNICIHICTKICTISVSYAS